MTILCAFGDSFINGKGDGSRLGWLGRVCAGHPLVLHNLGIPGNTSLDVAVRWRDEAERRTPSLLLFSFGTNDAAQGIAPTRTLDAARAILAAARSWLPTLMVGPPPVCDCARTDAAIAALSRDLAPICAGLDVPYLPVFDALSANATWRAEAAADDGSHPDAGGYGVLAGMVAAWPAWQASVKPDEQI